MFRMQLKPSKETDWLVANKPEYESLIREYKESED